MAYTRAVLFDTVSAILQEAYEDKKIRANPCRAKSVKRPKAVPRKVIPWPDSRVRAVRLALPAEYTVAVLLGAGIGLRQMEIFGFSPDDDRDEMIVNVQRQIGGSALSRCSPRPRAARRVCCRSARACSTTSTTTWPLSSPSR
ncbi:hypothetical protein [Amycolatopsis nivea]|uniref:hypothetical protein n=1 Tax=Amycolatopsis nivea TaxID=1644109 RepID=UPI001F0D5912|nr:hypothetical protein [Amycolatopsis nivea]